MRSSLSNWALRILYLAVAVVGYMTIKLLVEPSKSQYKKYSVQSISDNNTITENPVLKDISDTGSCYINTRGLPNSLGANINFYYPCQWQEYNGNFNIPTQIKQYVHETSDSLMVSVSFDIEKLVRELSDKEIYSITSQSFLSEHTQNEDKFVSSKRVCIDGCKGSCVIVKRDKYKSYSYYMTYLLYNGGIAIGMTYMLNTQSPKNADFNFYNIYLPLFERLAQKTKLIK
jgi:hypothetical protein